MEARVVFSVDAWFKQHDFSSYHAYLIPDTSEKPSNAMKRGNCWMSRSPDGFTIGNSHVFAAIGIPLMEAEQINEFYTNPRNDVPFIKDWDLSRMTALVGPDKATAHLQCIPAVYKIQEFHASFTLDGNLVDTWFKDAPRQVAMRVKNTSIVATRSDAGHVTLETINFIPRLPDEPVIHRIVSVKNNGPAALGDLAIDVTFENRASSWAWKLDTSRRLLVVIEERDRTSFTVKATCIDEALGVGACSREEKLSSLSGCGSDFKEIAGDGAGFLALRLYLGHLPPWAERTVYVSIFPTLPVSPMEPSIDSLDASKIQASLERTEKASASDPGIGKLTSSNPRITDLYDSILTMGTCHVGEKGIHAGSVYYSHGRAWTRDNFWIQKAFHHVGCHDAAIKNCKFFLDAWNHNGRRFANSYGLISYGPSNPGNEVLVELPWYFVLMMTEAWKWAPELARQQLPSDSVAELVHAAITEAKYFPGYLFPLNSDETWIWACDVSETGFVLDNAILALAALVSARRWLRVLLAPSLIQSIDDLATRITASIREHFLIPHRNRLAAARDDDGTLDESAIVVPMSMLFIHDVLDEYPDLLDPCINSLAACWHSCSIHVDGGGKVVRSHSATTSLTGNTTGHFIEAMGRVNARRQGDELLEGILNFVNATGAVNELHDIYDPSWGTEHRRLWDSMSVLQGIVQYFIGTRILPGAIVFTPYCPERIGAISIDDIAVRDHVFSFRMARKDGRLLCAVKMDGNEIARYEGLHDVSIDASTNDVKISPVRDLVGSKFKDRPRGDYWGRIIPSIANADTTGTSMALIHDGTSKNHAIEIERQLAFSLGRLVPIHADSDFPSINEQYDHFIWISREVPSLVRDAIMIKDVLDEFMARDYNIVAFDTRLPNRTVCWIPNKGHVYKDTNRFIQDIRLNVLPKRHKPMSMHPHGFLRLSDLVGAPVDDPVGIVVDCRPLAVPGTGEASRPPVHDLHLFIQGDAVHSFAGGTGSWQGTIEPTSSPRAMPKREDYVLVTAVTPFAPFDLAAAGIATGKHAVQVCIQADARIPLVVDITLKLPQRWHPQNLRSPQWERVDDPVRYVKLANGEKVFRITLHPGRPVSRHMRTKLPDTCRHLTFVFVKYPRLA
ncbi:MAG: hypothetical protein Q6353_016240 [Candidatus Sigynarchaeum springense]